MARPGKYPADFRERAVRMVFEHQSEHPSQWAAITTISRQLGINHETLRSWVRQAEADAGRRPDPQLEELKRLRRENARAEARQRDPQGGFSVFRSGARPSPAGMTRFVDEHRGCFGSSPAADRCRARPLGKPPHKVDAAADAVAARSERACQLRSGLDAAERGLDLGRVGRIASERRIGRPRGGSWFNNEKRHRPTQGGRPMIVLLVGNWRTLALRAICAVIFGLLALLWPDITRWALVLLFGA